jgi:hypothetical protein
MKVNLNILEVESNDYFNLDSNTKFELSGYLGSSPALSLSSVEGLTVPNGKVWLFPGGSNFESIERFIKGKRIIKSVRL